MAQLAIEIQIERLRVIEISNARDAAIERLSEAYSSIRQKNELIEHLQQESRIGRSGLASALTQLSQNRSLDYQEAESYKAHIATLEKTVEDLRSVLRQQQQQPQQQSLASKVSDPPPRYEESALKASTISYEESFSSQRSFHRLKKNVYKPTLRSLR